MSHVMHVHAHIREVFKARLVNELFINDIQLVTKFKNNMKNALMSWEDKILIRKRSVFSR